MARVVSSVTNITGSPSLTANSTASRVSLSMRSSVHPSAYWRIGEEPMKQEASMAMPVRCEISTIGWMSAITVRAAQLGAIFSFCSTISRASRSTSRTTCGPAPGRPMSADSMPSSAIMCRILSFSSIDGLRTDGDCRPSRSVSSSSSTRPRAGRSSEPPARFQS